MVVWILVSLVGLVVVAVSTAGAKHHRLHPAEVAVFHAVNGLPGWLYVVLWLPMQLGNLVVGTLAGVGVGVVEGSIGVAVGSLAAAGLKLVSERLIRHRMADWLPVRQRPGTSQAGAVLRGADVPRSGPSFPSGHVILAFGVACVVATVLAWPGVAIVFVLAAAVGIGRVFVGAHNPLDVSCGLGAGLVAGGTVAAVLVGA
jgi:undecaprenyl-diphosphatase